MVFGDNLGAVATSRSNKITRRTDHIIIYVIFHHFRSLDADNVVDIKYIETGLLKCRRFHEGLGRVSIHDIR